MLNDLIKRLTGRKVKSKDIAKKRLQFALVYDKLEVTDDILTDLQGDIIKVISKYFKIDRNALTLDIERGEEQSALVFNTPILAARRKKNN